MKLLLAMTVIAAGLLVTKNSYGSGGVVGSKEITVSGHKFLETTLVCGKKLITEAPMNWTPNKQASGSSVSLSKAAPQTR